MNIHYHFVDGWHIGRNTHYVTPGEVGTIPTYTINWPIPNGTLPWIPWPQLMVALPLLPDEMRRLMRYAWEHGTDEDRAMLRRAGYDFDGDAA